MYVRFATAIVLAAFVGTKAPVRPAADYAPIQGAWKTLRLNNASAADQGVDLVITFAGDKYNVAQSGSVIERGSLRVDTTKAPIALDLMIAEGQGAGTTQLGVFAIKGDTLTAVLGNPGETMRPSSLDVGAGALHVVAVRQK